MRQTLPLAAAALAALALTRPALAGDTPVSPDARIFIMSPKSGETVSSPVHVVFNQTGMEVAPAGAVVPNSGHYHLLIDAPLTDEQKKFAIPADAQHLHYGKAQTEATVELAPGTHVLQLVMGDGAHQIHARPVMSDPITVTVK